MTEESVIPFSEPLIVQDICLDGIEIRRGSHIVKCVGFATTPSIGQDQPAERRIVARFSIPLDVAREIWANLSNVLRAEAVYGDLRPEQLGAAPRARGMDS